MFVAELLYIPDTVLYYRSPKCLIQGDTDLWDWSVCSDLVEQKNGVQMPCYVKVILRIQDFQFTI